VGLLIENLRIGAQRESHILVGLRLAGAVMLEVAPLDAKERLAQSGARGVVLVGGRCQRHGENIS
jgi:hypothetical protein